MKKVYLFLSISLSICLFGFLQVSHAQDVQRNYANEIRLCQEKAEAGDADSQYQLALYYHNGLGVSKNYSKSFEWLSKAAQQNISDAQYLLYLYYRDGYLEENDEKALEWLLKAAENENLDAQFELGKYYLNGGLGLSSDPAKTFEWFRRSAKQGHAKAQSYLAYCYDEGIGCRKDHHSAVEWWRKSAEQGYQHSQYMLAVAYMLGDGVVPIDVQESTRWATLAANQTDNPEIADMASELLTHLETKIQPGTYQLVDANNVTWIIVLKDDYTVTVGKKGGEDRHYGTCREHGFARKRLYDGFPQLNFSIGDIPYVSFPIKDRDRSLDYAIWTHDYIYESSTAYEAKNPKLRLPIKRIK